MPSPTPSPTPPTCTGGDALGCDETEGGVCYQDSPDSAPWCGCAQGFESTGAGNTWRCVKLQVVPTPAPPTAVTYTTSISGYTVTTFGSDEQQAYRSAVASALFDVVDASAVTVHAGAGTAWSRRSAWRVTWRVEAACSYRHRLG